MIRNGHLALREPPPQASAAIMRSTPIVLSSWDTHWTGGPSPGAVKNG